LNEIERVKTTLSDDAVLDPDNQAGWALAHERANLIQTISNENELLKLKIVELEYLLATIAIDRNTDEQLTCVLCKGAPCEFSFTTRSGGVTAWFGIHKECRQRARSALETKP